MKIHKLKFSGLLLLLCLTACTHNPQPLGKPLPQLSYEHLISSKAYGGGVEVMQSFIRDESTRKALQEFALAPDDLIKRYANARFDREARPVKMIFDVQTAHLNKVTDEDNLAGFLSGAAEDRFYLEVFITMSPLDDNGTAMEAFTINLKRELFLSQRLSLAEKEFRQFEFMEKVINDIDKVVMTFINERMR